MDRRSFLRASTHTAVGFGILRAIGARREPTAPGATAAPPSPFAALRERYFVRSLALNPVTATYLGGDAYAPALADVNGRLRDTRPAALAREAAFYRDTRRALRAIAPAALAGPDRVDHALMEAQLAFLLRQHERRYHERAVDSYVAEPFRGVDWQLQQMTDVGDGLLGTEAEWRQVVRRLTAVPAYVRAAEANLRAGKAAGRLPDRRMVQRDGIDGSTANAEYFARTLPGLARGFLGARPFAARTLADLTAAATGAARAYTGFAGFLRATYDLTETADRFAVGAEEYEWRVRTVLGDRRTAAQLHQYGAEQVALYEGKIFDVARAIAAEARLELAWGTPAEQRAGVRRVIEHLAKDSPSSDDELFRLYREAGTRAVAYGREHDLFDIPAEYRLDVYPTPPVLRSTIDAAYYPAPPFKRSGVGRFYLTPTGNDAAALRENNRASVADTAVHEGFPGHDWHYKYMTRHAAEISNVRWLTPGAVEDSSSMWSDSPTMEGWGLYSEELMAEPRPGRPYGFYSAAEYMYELQGQLMRAVRVHVDTGIHTGRLSFDDAVRYFAEHVSFYPDAPSRAASDPAAKAVTAQAERAIYRYSKWPTQAITYNLGKNAIIALREDYKRKRGAAYSAKEFHQRFMRAGSVPVGLFREEFLAGP
jgi:uncharacterized protein (DUF885 family)